MILKEISKTVAESFFRQYEHLGNCGLGVWHYGLFENEELLSVVSYGPTSFNPNRSFLGVIGKKYSLRIIQLARGGTRYDAKNNIPTSIIKISMREIRKRFGDCIIVAYSDTKWNEVGTVYQASNFLYCGLTNPKGQSNYKINGKKCSGWVVRKRFGTRDIERLRANGIDVEKIPLNQKHMYVYVKAGKLKKRLVIKELDKKYSCNNNRFPNRTDLNVGSMAEYRKH